MVLEEAQPTTENRLKTTTEEISNFFIACIFNEDCFRVNSLEQNLSPKLHPIQKPGNRRRMPVMVKTVIEYTGDLHCIATHGPSGVKVETDAPVDNHGRGLSFSPTDLVGAALGTCMATIMGICATRLNLDLNGMRIEVSKEMTQAAPRRIARLATEIWVPIPAEADPSGALEQAARTGPVSLWPVRLIKPDMPCAIWSTPGQPP